MCLNINNNSFVPNNGNKDEIKCLPKPFSSALCRQPEFILTMIGTENYKNQPRKMKSKTYALPTSSASAQAIYLYIIQSLHAGTLPLTPPRAPHLMLRKLL